VRSREIVAHLAIVIVGICCALPIKAANTNFEEERKRAFDIGIRGDVGESFRILRRLCEQGDVRSQELLGSALVERGEFLEAEKWLMLAAKNGGAQAKWHLYRLFLQKKPPDPREAEKWLRAAADQGHVAAQDAIEDEKSMPKIVNGLVSVDSFAAFVHHSGKRKMSRFNDAQFGCYKLTRPMALKALDEGSQICKKDALKSHGERISANFLNVFAREHSTFVTAYVLKQGNITIQDLGTCLNSIASLPR
jgi:TPR repeat protein